MPTMFDPYCGPAPDPATLLGRWNFDPVLLCGLAVLAAILAWRRTGTTRDFAAVAGFGLLVVAFVSPLCALASALFSARVFHHVLLVAGAAPLLAMALPYQGFPRAARFARWRRWLSQYLPVPQTAFAAHTLLFWIWHSPGAYGVALSSDLAYWAMQVSLFGSAFWLWRIVLSPRCSTGTALSLMLGTILQMGMLAALLTFSRAPLYAAHLSTTEAFGLSALEDQQLAGVLMWVPAALPYLLAALTRLWRMLQEPAAEAYREGRA